jgi:hypothetical protein
MAVHWIHGGISILGNAGKNGCSEGIQKKRRRIKYLSLSGIPSAAEGGDSYFRNKEEFLTFQ